MKEQFYHTQKVRQRIRLGTEFAKPRIVQRVELTRPEQKQYPRDTQSAMIDSTLEKKSGFKKLITIPSRVIGKGEKPMTQRPGSEQKQQQQLTDVVAQLSQLEEAESQRKQHQQQRKKGNHPDEEFKRQQAEKDYEAYLEHKKVRDEESGIVTLHQDGPLMETIDMGSIQDLQPVNIPLNQDAINNLPPAQKADLERQLEAFGSLKGLLLELKARASAQEGNALTDPRAISESVNKLVGLRGQALGILSQEAQDIIHQTVVEFRQRIQDVASETIEYGFYGERKLNDDQIRLIKNPNTPELELDELFNRIYDKADSDPHQAFEKAQGSAGQQEWVEFKRTLEEALNPQYNPFLQEERIVQWLQSPNNPNQLVNPDPQTLQDAIVQERSRRLDILEKRRVQYIDENNTRQITHNANFAVLTGASIEELYKFVGGFRTSFTDLAFRKRGVMEAYRYYTQALLRIRSKYGGYIPQTAMVSNPLEGKQYGEVEELARRMFDQALDSGVIRDPGDHSEIDAMDDWEKNRAFSMAKGLGILMGTTIEIAATSIIPPENQFVGLYARPIVERLQAYRTIVKYDIGEAKGAVLYFMMGKKGKWTKEEMYEYYHTMKENPARALNIMNGLIEEDHDRLLTMLNIFGLGGLVSRTTWRAREDPVTGSLGKLTAEDRDWVGAGLVIEKERDNLGSDKKLEEADRQAITQEYGVDVQTEGEKARFLIGRQLERMRQLQPLILYQKIPKVQGEVLQRLFGQRLTQLGILHIGDPQAFEKEYNLTYLNEGLIETKLKSKEEYKTNPAYRQQVDDLVSEISQLSIDLSIWQDAALKRRDTTLTQAGNDTQIDKRVYGTLDQPGMFSGNKVFRGLGQLTPQQQEFMQGVQDSFNVNEYINTLQDKSHRQPFIFDVTGLDMQEILWQKAGDDAISRRWGDMLTAEAGAKAVTDFVKGMSHYKSPEDVAKGLEPIYSAVSEYDAGFAKDLVKKLGEGAIKFYSKDWYARLPFGIGTAVGLKGNTSFSQAVMGSDAMAWDEIDASKFTGIMREWKIYSLADQREIQRKTIARLPKVVAAYLRAGVPLIALAVTFYIFKKSLEDSV